MNKIRTIIFAVVILVFASGAVFSLDIDDLQDAMGKFSDEVSKSVPFNSTIGLNWSDAYIGKFFPSLPPHFGFGLTAGFTTLGVGSFNKVLAAIDSNDIFPSFLSKMGMPMPAYTVEARLGGIVFPFDVGLKVGYLPLDLASVGIDYLLVGADLRWRVFDPDLLPIKVSVGFGYNYLKGGVRVPVGKGLQFSVPGEGSTIHNMELEQPKIGFLWGTNTFELKAQVSFKLLIITPYIGTGLGYSLSHAGYEFRTKLKIDGEDTDFSEEAIAALNELGISGISSNGFESIANQNNFNMRLFGGISLNLTIFKIDLNVMYNMMNNNWGATLGTRIQF